MDATKENARAALEAFGKLKLGDGSSIEEDAALNTAANLVEDFLRAAERKLPSQASYDKDRNRPRGRRPAKVK